MMFGRERGRRKATRKAHRMRLMSSDGHSEGNVAKISPINGGGNQAIPKKALKSCSIFRPTASRSSDVSMGLDCARPLRARKVRSLLYDGGETDPPLLGLFIDSFVVVVFVESFGATRNAITSAPNRKSLSVLFKVMDLCLKCGLLMALSGRSRMVIRQLTLYVRLGQRR